MRTIAKVDPTVKITGISINQYQIDTCNTYNAKHNLSARCKAVQGNFLEMPFEDGTFDGAYAVEATCHAPQLEKVYGEVFRVIKSGSYFVSYEWVKTNKFDKGNDQHVDHIHDIVIGNALPTMRSEKEVRFAAETVGFEVVMIEDQALKSAIPWYSTLKRSTLSRNATQVALTIMEFFWLVPRGTSQVHLMLCNAAEGLVVSGSEGIFTPMCTCVFKKPL